MKDLQENRRAWSAPYSQAQSLGCSHSLPSPVLFCQLHHHGGEFIEHEDPWQALVPQQPISNLLMPGHRELVCPQHLW